MSELKHKEALNNRLSMPFHNLVINSFSGCTPAMV